MIIESQRLPGDSSNIEMSLLTTDASTAHTFWILYRLLQLALHFVPNLPAYHDEMNEKGMNEMTEREEFTCRQDR